LDGTKISFAFSKQTDMIAARQIKLDSLWESSRLIVEADGEILIFPISSIKYIQFSGDQTTIDQIKFPPHAIHGATILDLDNTP
jgi:hypothetical protein